MNFIVLMIVVEFRQNRGQHNFLDEAKYEKWGGFAAATSSCASFAPDRQLDAHLSNLFDRTDLLSHRCEHNRSFQTTHECNDDQQSPRQMRAT